MQLDSATSLIQAAKNLMNAVVLAVKASYVASTKYSRSASGVSAQYLHYSGKLDPYSSLNNECRYSVLQYRGWTLELIMNGK